MPPVPRQTYAIHRASMDTKAIGENVKFYRRLWKLTQRELAKKTHMTQQNVVLIEKGSTMPPPDTLEALSDALDVPLPDLYCDGESYHISFDFTPYYVDRMSHEAEEVQEVMRQALKECNNDNIYRS